MRSNRPLALAAVVALLASFSGLAGAQTPMHPNNGHMGMGNMHGRMGGLMPGMGSIVGNKSTKVYHLPGDKGNMPSAKNRVFFRTEAEAIRAGYHLAGKKHGKMPVMRPMHGAMRPMTGSHMNGRLPK